MTACSNAPAARSSGPHGTTTRPLPAASAPAWGNNWVVVGVVVALPFVAHRQVCLPVLCRLWQPRQRGRSKLDLACELVGLVCDRYPDHTVHLTGDAAYAGKALRGLPTKVTVTTRLRADAALYGLPGPRRPGQRG